MGIIFKFDVEDTIGSAWLLESFQRRFSQSSNEDQTEDTFRFSGTFQGSSQELATSDHRYIKRLISSIRQMMDNIGSSTRELNHEETQLIKFPVIQGHLLKTVPNGVMNIYWNLNQDAYFSKQTAINAFLQIDPEKFLMRPCTELTQHFDDKQCQSPGTGRHRSSNNNDASRKSRIKKRLSTLLLFESYETDQLESAILDEDELQLHLMIALLEDKVFALTSNVRLIDHYRDLSCLA